jgi:hypothetical protein
MGAKSSFGGDGYLYWVSDWTKEGVENKFPSLSSMLEKASGSPPNFLVKAPGR